MYAADRLLQHKKEITDKAAILQSNLSLLEKRKALTEADIPCLLEEILASHPYNWDEEDEITRKVWLRRMGRI